MQAVKLIFNLTSRFLPGIPPSPAIAFSLQPKTFKIGRRKVGKIGNEETVMYKRFYHTNYQSVYQKKKTQNLSALRLTTRT